MGSDPVASLRIAAVENEPGCSRVFVNENCLEQILQNMKMFAIIKNMHEPPNAFNF